MLLLVSRAQRLEEPHPWIICQSRGFLLNSREREEEPDEAPSELRGFAFYVGLSESRARENGVQLLDVVSSLRDRVTALVPSAESHTVAIIGPMNRASSDLDIVLQAIGKSPEPPKEPTQAPVADGDDPGVVIDLGRHRLLVDGRDAHLTYKEFSLLQELVKNQGRSLSREHLRRMTSTPNDPDVNDRTIDVKIRRLRRKFGPYPDLIRTIHGLGYRFDARRDVTVLRNATPSPDLI
jgi:DNA-binding winged helix-turn-helix (wHTH) protein